MPIRGGIGSTRQFTAFLKNPSEEMDVPAGEMAIVTAGLVKVTAGFVKVTAGSVKVAEGFAKALGTLAMSTAGLAVVCGHRTKVAAGGCLGSGEVGTSSRDAVAATGTLRRFAAVRKHSSQGTATVASVLPGCGRKAGGRDSDLLPVRFAFEITANCFPPDKETTMWWLF